MMAMADGFAINTAPRIFSPCSMPSVRCCRPRISWRRARRTPQRLLLLSTRRWAGVAIGHCATGERIIWVEMGHSSE